MADLELRLHIRYNGIKATQYFTKFTSDSQTVLREDLVHLKLPHPKKEHMNLLSHGLVECVWYNVQPKQALHRNITLKCDQADEKMLRLLSISSVVYKEIRHRASKPINTHGVKRPAPASGYEPASTTTGLPGWAAPALPTASIDDWELSERPSKYARVEHVFGSASSASASTSTKAPFPLPPKPNIPPPPTPPDFTNPNLIPIASDARNSKAKASSASASSKSKAQTQGKSTSQSASQSTSQAKSKSNPKSKAKSATTSAAATGSGSAPNPTTSNPTRPSASGRARIIQPSGKVASFASIFGSDDEEERAAEASLGRGDGWDGGWTVGWGEDMRWGSGSWVKQEVVEYPLLPPAWLPPPPPPRPRPQHRDSVSYPAEGSASAGASTASGSGSAANAVRVKGGGDANANGTARSLKTSVLVHPGPAGAGASGSRAPRRVPETSVSATTTKSKSKLPPPHSDSRNSTNSKAPSPVRFSPTSRYERGSTPTWNPDYGRGLTPTFTAPVLYTDQAAPAPAPASVPVPFKPAPSAFTPQERAELQYKREMGRREQMKKAKEIAGVTGQVPGSGSGGGETEGKTKKVKRASDAPRAPIPVSVVSSTSSRDSGSGSGSARPGKAAVSSSALSSSATIPAPVQSESQNAVFRVKEEPEEVSLFPPPVPPAPAELSVAPTPLFLPSSSDTDLSTDVQTGMDMDMRMDVDVSMPGAVADSRRTSEDRKGKGKQKQRDLGETESQKADRVVKNALKTLQIKKESLSPQKAPQKPSTVRAQDVLQDIDIQRITNSPSIPWDLISVALSTTSVHNQSVDAGGSVNAVASSSRTKLLLNTGTGATNAGTASAHVPPASMGFSIDTGVPQSRPPDHAPRARTSKPSSVLPTPPPSAITASDSTSAVMENGNQTHNLNVEFSAGPPSALGPSALAPASASSIPASGSGSRMLSGQGPSIIQTQSFDTKAAPSANSGIVPLTPAATSASESASPPVAVAAVSSAPSQSHPRPQLPAATAQKTAETSEEDFDFDTALDGLMARAAKANALHAQRLPPRTPSHHDLSSVSRQNTITNLTREACDIKRQVTALVAREEVVFEELERLGADCRWVPERVRVLVGGEDGDKISGENEMQSRIKDLEKQLAEERFRREEAENAIKDVRRELKAPFVVPSLLDAFVDLSKLTTRAMRPPAGPGGGGSKSSSGLKSARAPEAGDPARSSEARRAREATRRKPESDSNSLKGTSDPASSTLAEASSLPTGSQRPASASSLKDIEAKKTLSSPDAMEVDLSVPQMNYG